MIGCKPLCFFGEVPPRHERTKKKPYAGGDRAGTACRQTDTVLPRICLPARKPVQKKASISLEHWKATLPRKNFFKSLRNLWRSSTSVLASTSTFWIGRCIWMRERRTSTNAMCSTVRTNSAPARNWVGDNGKIIEPLFADYFLSLHPMRCFQGRLFTVDGMIEDEAPLKKEIYEMWTLTCFYLSMCQAHGIEKIRINLKKSCSACSQCVKCAE